MSWNKQHLRNEILTEVKNQMLILSKSNKKDGGRPNYSWLYQKPRLSPVDEEKLEELTTKLGETECKTAVMALRKQLGSHTAASANDVPVMMCQILQQLIQDHNTTNLFSAGMERRRNMPQRPQTTGKVTPQDTIETITKHVEVTTADHTNG